MDNNNGFLGGMQEARENRLAQQSGAEALEKKLNEQTKKKVKKTIVKIIITKFTTALIILILTILPIIIISLFFVSIFEDGDSNSVYKDSLKSTNTTSAFGCELSRDEFITAVEAYNGGSDYNTYMVPYAGDFYDICTNDKYNINPCLAFAHACVETKFGSSDACKENKNYFGMAHYNTADSGTVYSSVADSITAYCEWVIDASTEGTESYNSNYAVGQEYAEYNEKLAGTPDNNIYVLYCRYAYLGDTHLCDEPNFNSPAGIEYYINHGSDWGKGGRIMMYAMYEEGGLYTGKYKELCGHAGASDPTTTQEKADYAEYTTKLRLDIGKNIFGENCFGSITIEANGDIVKAAVKCHEYLRTNGYKYDQKGLTIPEGIENGKVIDCSAYVTWVLYEAGLENMKGNQQTSSSFDANNWDWEVVDVDEAIPGDILVYNSGGIKHVEIVANNDGSDYYRVYSCGSDYEINNEGTTEFPESTQTGFSKSQVKKVLRPPINSEEGED